MDRRRGISQLDPPRPRQGSRLTWSNPLPSASGLGNLTSTHLTSHPGLELTDIRSCRVFRHDKGLAAHFDFQGYFFQGHPVSPRREKMIWWEIEIRARLTFNQS